MMNHVPFCTQQRSGRVAPISGCMPPAGDDAAVVRPNPDPFHSSHAFTLSGPDELDDMLVEYLTTRCHIGARMKALTDITRWAASKGAGACLMGFERHQSLGGLEGSGACVRV
jgi:hypothetical protein